MSRWRDLFGPSLGLPDSGTSLKPSLGSEAFKLAFRLACESLGIRMRETRNSENQFVPEVFNFDLPAAFRGPIFRPSRTMHVVFDRDIYAAVRGQNLGTVRGQPIRPVLAGFGEPFTDWLFQTAMHANIGSNAFALGQAADLQLESGWLLIYALRWMGKSRRLTAPDSIVVCHVSEAGHARPLAPAEAIRLVGEASVGGGEPHVPSEEVHATGRKLAQEVLRTRAMNRDAFARGAAGISLLMVGSIS